MKHIWKRILAAALCTAILFSCMGLTMIVSGAYVQPDSYHGSVGENLQALETDWTNVLHVPKPPIGTFFYHSTIVFYTSDQNQRSVMKDYEEGAEYPWQYPKYTERIRWGENGQGIPKLYGIGQRSLASLPSLVEVAIPDSVKSIGTEAFCDDTSLPAITIPDSVVQLGPGIFKNCEKLATVHLGTGLTYLSEYMFEGCTSLTSITIPSNIKEIGEYTFLNCSALQTVRYLGTPAQWRELMHSSRSRELAIADVEFVYSGTESNWMQWEVDAATGALTIQHTGAMADYSLTNPAPWDAWRDTIRSVSFSDGVTRIGNYAFASCTALEQVDVPASVASIGAKAFYDCPALQSVQFHSDEIEVAYDSFAHSGEFTVCCTENSFWHMYAVSNGLRYVLTDETASTAFAIRNRSLLSYAGTADKITLPSDVSAVGYEALRGNNTVTRVALPQSVTSIADYAFADCANLSEAFVPESVTSIGANAFDGTDATVICMENSYAHKFAQSHGLAVKFVRILIDMEHAVMRLEIPYADEPDVSLVHLTGISLSVVGLGSMPAKTAYRVGEALDTEGLTLEAQYSNGMTDVLRAGYAVSAPIFDAPGEKTITLSYGGQTVEFAVTVTDEVVSGDLNESGTIDLKDAVLISRYLSGGWNVQADEANADVNKDGRVDLRDAAILRRFLAGGWNIALR